MVITDWKMTASALFGQNFVLLAAGVLSRVLYRPDDEAEEEGGDPVCWAHLVCEECGAITSEGHRAGCSLVAAG